MISRNYRGAPSRGLRDFSLEDFLRAVQNDVLPTVLPAILSGGVLEQIFSSVFPQGAPVDFEIPRFATVLPTIGVEAVLCPDGGCAGQITVQRLEIRPQPSTDTTVYNFLCTIYVSAKTVRPVPLTALGDLNLDFDTARGARSQLAFTAPLTICVDTARVIPSAVRIKPDLVPLPIAVWIGKIVTSPGFELEETDLTITGTGLLGSTISSGLNIFKSELVNVLRNELEFALNSQVCTRYAMTCLPEFIYHPAPPTPSVIDTIKSYTPSTGKIVIGIGAAAVLFALLKK